MPSHNQNSSPFFRLLPGTAADFHKPVSPGKSDQSQNIAAIYNEAGDEYAAYADGDPEHLFVFNGLHAYADRYVWAVLDAKLSSLRASGASSVSLLDAGCGPGTWLRRLVIRARELGFTAIRARGFDFAEAQSDRARFQAADLASLPGVNLSFDVADLGAPLPEAAASVDSRFAFIASLAIFARPGRLCSRDRARNVWLLHNNGAPDRQRPHTLSCFDGEGGSIQTRPPRGRLQNRFPACCLFRKTPVNTAVVARRI